MTDSGATILVLVLLRLLVRLIVGVPALPRGTPRWVDALSHLNHRLLYLVLIVQPVIGYLAKARNGHGLSLFGYYSIPPAFTANPAWAEWLGEAHEVGAEVLIVLVTLHVLGAFYHGVDPPRRRGAADGLTEVRPLKGGLWARSIRRLRKPGFFAGSAALAAFSRARASSRFSRSFSSSHLSRLSPALAARFSS